MRIITSGKETFIYIYIYIEEEEEEEDLNSERKKDNNINAQMECFVDWQLASNILITLACRTRFYGNGILKALSPMVEYLYQVKEGVMVTTSIFCFRTCY